MRVENYPYISMQLINKRIIEFLKEHEIFHFRNIQYILSINEITCVLIQTQKWPFHSNLDNGQLVAHALPNIVPKNQACVLYHISKHSCVHYDAYFSFEIPAYPIFYPALLLVVLS